MIPSSHRKILLLLSLSILLFFTNANGQNIEAYGEDSIIMKASLVPCSSDQCIYTSSKELSSTLDPGTR